MSARAVSALLRASWFQARSYRIAMVWQIVGLLMTVVPTYFISTALQDMMAQSIAAEADQFFAFVLVGAIAMTLVSAAWSTLPVTISGGISSGYFESLLMTRSSLSAVLVGLSSYGLLLTFVRSAIMLAAGWVLGARVAWHLIAPALVILLLLLVAHWAIGLLATALVIAFRTYGPLLAGMTVVSMLFGGVYYPVSSIPSWLQAIAAVTPLAYGTRALRRVLLQGDGSAMFSADVGMVIAFAVLLLMAGALAMQWALHYARRSGTLGSY